MVTKRNHYVPQFYLKHFLTSGADTHWVYYKEDGRIIAQRPIDTAVQSYLYTFAREDGSKDDSIETQVFCPIEDLAKPILNRWRFPNATIKEDEIPNVSPFLSFIHTRVPRQIEIIKEMGIFHTVKSAEEGINNPDEIKKYFEYLKQQGEENIPTVDELKQELRYVKEHNMMVAQHHPSLIMSISMSEHINKLLLGMKWSLCEADSDIKFITCDSPFVPFVMANDGKAIFGAGFAAHNIQISFPISPEMCLLIYRSDSKPPDKACGNFVREINNRTAFMAEMFLISPFKSKYVQSLAAEFAHTLKRPKLDYDILSKYYNTVRRNKPTVQ